MFSQRLGSNEQGKWVGGQDSRIHPQAGGGLEPGLPPQLSPGAHLKQDPTPTSAKSRRQEAWPLVSDMSEPEPLLIPSLYWGEGRVLRLPVILGRILLSLITSGLLNLSTPLCHLQQTASPGYPVSPTGKRWLHPLLPRYLLMLTPQTVPISGLCDMVPNSSCKPQLWTEQDGVPMDPVSLLHSACYIYIWLPTTPKWTEA